MRSAVFRRFLHSDPDPAVVFLKKVALVELAVCIVGLAYATWTMVF